MRAAAFYFPLDPIKMKRCSMSLSLSLDDSIFFFSLAFFLAKRAKLSRSQRDGVEVRFLTLHSRGAFSLPLLSHSPPYIILGPRLLNRLYYDRSA